MERSDSMTSFRSCSEEDAVSVGDSYVCLTPVDGGSSPQVFDSSNSRAPSPPPTEPSEPSRPSSRAETPRSFFRRTGSKRRAPPPPTSPSPVPSPSVAPVSAAPPPTTIHLHLQDVTPEAPAEPINRLLRVVTRPVAAAFPEPNTTGGTTVPGDVAKSNDCPASLHLSTASTNPRKTTAAPSPQVATGSVTAISQVTGGGPTPPPAPQRSDSLHIATTMSARTNRTIRLIDEESDSETTDSFVKVKSVMRSPVITSSVSSTLPRTNVEIPPMPTGVQPQNIIRPQPVTLSVQQATPGISPEVPVNHAYGNTQFVIQPSENDSANQPVQPSAFQPIQLVQQLAHLPAEQLIHLAQLQQQTAHQQSALYSQQQVTQSISQPIQSVPIDSHSDSLPRQSFTQEQSAKLSSQSKIGENDADLYQNTDFQAGAGIPVPGDSMLTSGHVTRGRARQAKQQGLMHSASDPGIVRMCHAGSPPQYPRYPGTASLDHLSEEEDDNVNMEDTLDGYIKATRGRPHLVRSDSVVTVAHLYEDIMVSPRLRCKVTLTNLTVVVLLGAIVCPNTAIMLYTIFRLVFGTLFPAYYSYKAVKTKNVKEYVKWMMYWIVFAFFTCFETITDLFLSFWFPFYYELKILVVLWLLSPATRGSSILYRKFVHPWLTRREEDIDDCIAKAKQQGYSTVIQLGTKGVNYATTVLMQTAIKGGGGIVNQLRRSYSSGELNEGDLNRNVKALPHVLDDDDFDGHYDSSNQMTGTDEPRHTRAESDGGYKPRGSSTSRVARSSGKTRSADVTEYYQDVAEDTVGRRRSPRTQDSASRILSVEDLTSGYSSCDPDSGDLIYDYRHELDQMYHNLDPIVEPKPKAKVRRTQSMNINSTRVRRGAGGSGRSSGEGKGGGTRASHASRDLETISDLGAPNSYSSTGHHPALTQQHGSSFRRSRPGEISAYATLPRTSKRTATKKRQV